MMMKEAKTRLRRQAEAARSALPPEERKRKSEAICEAAIARFRQIAPSGKRVLFTYIPFGAEVDATPLIDWCWREGIAVAAPLSEPTQKALRLHYIASYEDLQTGPWGIREPKPSCPELKDFAEISLMLMPGLAFDAALSRLGYGGGYYDRFLDGLKRTGTPFPYRLALAFDVQVMDDIPTEAHDYRVDGLLTESRSFP